jgi:hypothetical protein
MGKKKLIKDDSESENNNEPEVQSENETIHNSDTENKKDDSEDKLSEKSENDTDVDESDEEPEVDDSKILKKNVSEYIKIDDLIREKKEEIKELIEKRFEHEGFLTNYLEKAGKTKIETKDGEIVYKKTSSKSPLKEELVEKAIVKKFQDTKKITESGIKIAHDIIEEVNNMRDVKVKSNIKRIKKREMKSKN